MKRYMISLLLSSLFLTMGFSQQIVDERVSLLYGEINKEDSNSKLLKQNQIYLYQVVNGVSVRVANSFVCNNRFAFSFIVETEGFFLLANSSLNEIYSTFYFKPKESLNIELHDGYFTAVDGGSNENLEMAKWTRSISHLRNSNIMLASLNEAMSYPVDKSVSKAFAKRLMNLHQLSVLDTFLKKTSIKSLLADEVSLVLKVIESSDIADYPLGISLLNSIITSKLPEETVKNTSMESILQLAAEGARVLKRKEQLELWSFFLVNKINDYKDVSIFEKKLPEVASNDRIKKALYDKRLELFNPFEARGKDYVDFQLEDVNGQKVALSDFPDKVIYIDFWATWCGPCFNEMPALLALMDKYKDKEVVFISISLDESNKHKEWKQIIEEKQLKGIQLFAGEKEKLLSKTYGINSIPRFMLIDKTGKIDNLNAPRPSSDQIEEALNKLL